MKSLLIVEDEPALREILVAGLEELGVSMTTAANGRIGMELLRQKSFDAVLSDIQMPELNGLELLLAARGAGISCPFVFLTAYGEQEFILQALRLGALDFLIKPFDLQDVVSVTGRALEIGFRRNSILQLRKTPGHEQKIEKAERMISLFRLANNSKRRA